VVNKLEDKRALITGGASGIGLAAARCFVEQGAAVLLAGRREQALRDAVSELGAKAHYIVADVSKPEDNRRMLQATLERLGGIDVFVANAGVEGVSAPLVDYPLEAFDEVMAVNVRGVFLGLQCAIPAMRARGGSIVIVSSIGGIKARGTGNSAYVASKHAEIGLMRTAAMECAPHAIRVNCVLPGPTDTRMIQSIEEGRSPGAPEKARAAILAGLPLKRYGTPEEVAALIVFLAGDEASICTGGVYLADGGLSAI
jgi:NAD(P)-dependent dehydrogenase (short-subunit alcohol dehydrogenase family)